MNRFLTVLLVAAVPAFAAPPAPPPDIESLVRQVAELLALHARGRQAHLRTDVDVLLSDAGEEFISVSGGRVSRITPAEERTFFTKYFKDAAYEEWDDLEPPIVRVSADGTMGWVITRLRVRRTQKDASGAAKETRFVYAGIMTYEKRDGRWVRVANVSTFE